MKDVVFNFDDLYGVQKHTIMRATKLTTYLDIPCMTKNGNVIRVRMKDDLPITGISNNTNLVTKAEEHMDYVMALFRSTYGNLYANFERYHFTFSIN